ncbi:MAG: hypothetical protein LBT64_00435 [Puniceicoccales bacterium]|jgi:hypothetical protein|nr:hypothetical protein [Puniceicoccales bacterium]
MYAKTSEKFTPVEGRIIITFIDEDAAPVRLTLNGNKIAQLSCYRDYIKTKTNLGEKHYYSTPEIASLHFCYSVSNGKASIREYVRDGCLVSSEKSHGECGSDQSLSNRSISDDETPFE